MSALTDYLDLLVRPTNSGIISINDAVHVLAPLGIEWRLVCRAQMVPSEGPLLVVSTSDPSPVLSVHDRAGRPAAGKLLECRREVGPDTWEYDLRAPGEKGLVGEFAVRLSWSGKHRRIPFYPPIPTLVHLVGWGKDFVDVDVSVAIDSVELAWAVTELLTGQLRPAPEFHNQYERLRAARVLAEHFGVR